MCVRASVLIKHVSFGWGKGGERERGAGRFSESIDRCSQPNLGHRICASEANTKQAAVYKTAVEDRSSVSVYAQHILHIMELYLRSILLLAVACLCVAGQSYEELEYNEDRSPRGLIVSRQGKLQTHQLSSTHTHTLIGSSSSDSATTNRRSAEQLMYGQFGRLGQLSQPCAVSFRRRRRVRPVRLCIGRLLYASSRRKSNDNAQTRHFEAHRQR